MPQITPAQRLALLVSGALAGAAGLAAGATLVSWRVLRSDAPMWGGNARGTALTVLALALPLLLGGMTAAARGSLRGRFLWLGSAGSLAYNAVMFCFALHFNAFFLLYTTMLGLAAAALTTLVPTFDRRRLEAALPHVHPRAVALWLLASFASFALLWLRDLVPALLANTAPAAVRDGGLTQHPVWVLDFAFTFPLMLVGASELWRGRALGVLVGGALVILLTLETAGIVVDQLFGRLHDPSASLAAVPALVVFTAGGVLFSWLFLRGIGASPPAPTMERA